MLIQGKLSITYGVVGFTSREESRPDEAKAMPHGFRAVAVPCSAAARLGSFAEMTNQNLAVSSNLSNA